MITSRGTRRLDLNFEKIGAELIDVPKVESEEPIFTKEQLRELFKDEIDLIINCEVEALKDKAEISLKMEFDQKISEASIRVNEHLNTLEKERKNLSALAESLKSSYQKKVSEDISMLNEMVTEICIQSLYKIIGDPNCYIEFIEKNINEVIQKKSLDSKITLNVSESDMKYLKKQFHESKWLDCLRVDMHLEDGEMVLDDGVASLYEVGFTKQLDVLRAAFIKLVRTNNAN